MERKLTADLKKIRLERRISFTPYRSTTPHALHWDKTRDFAIPISANYCLSYDDKPLISYHLLGRS
jgi:hypothetical protein